MMSRVQPYIGWVNAVLTNPKSRCSIYTMAPYLSLIINQTLWSNHDSQSAFEALEDNMLSQPTIRFAAIGLNHGHI